MESNKFGYKLYNKYVVYTNECGSNQHVIVICCFFSLGALPVLSCFSRKQIAVQILGRTWLEWIRLSRIFRAPFANLSLKIVSNLLKMMGSSHPGMVISVG